MNFAVFISKTVDSDGILASWCAANNVVLRAESLLMFEPVQFELATDFEVVFFASPRAVKFFFEAFTLNASIQIACAGEATKKSIEARGYAVAFTSSESGKIEQESKHFADWVDGRKVFFPSSNRSKKSYQQFLNQSQISEVICYNTLLLDKQIEECDLYVLTSPSNVESFLKMNQFQKGSNIIAWGETTAAYLENRGVEVSETLSQASEEELIRSLTKLLN